MAKATQLDLDLGLAAFESEGYARGFRCVAGIDESGRGPLAGPVVAAAVILAADFKVEGVKDSKVLTAKQRERLALLIKADAVSWGLGVIDVEEIDRFNILRASLMAMAQACQTLAPAPDCLLIDGNQTIPAAMFAVGRLSVRYRPRQKAIVKGDALCLSIAAASILAKVARDEIMMELDRRFPQYGFACHKGYCSADHLTALRRHGPSPVHRRSFTPVRELYDTNELLIRR